MASGVDSESHCSEVKGDLDTSLTKSSKNRKKLKSLIRRIQNQIEFYFGDANLPKDKFLKQKISEDPDGYVPVSVIAGFKKIQLLSKDKDHVLNAIRQSSLLELSEDCSGVRRATPLPDHTPSDVDARTIYVEHLPIPTTTHDSLRGQFQRFGDVAYISLPRFKNGKIKGFGFVEFETVEAAEIAVKYFKERESEARADSGGGESSNQTAASTMASDQEMGVASDGENPRKRPRTSDTEDEGASRKVARVDSQSSDTQEEGGASENGRKKRKKNRQHKKRVDSTLLPHPPADIDGLRVMSKAEWNSFKTIFKSIQKEHSKVIKQEIKKNSESKSGRGFVGECLVRVECVDGANVQTISEMCGRYGEVAYVDIQDGDSEGFVRYRKSGCVSALVEGATPTGIKFSSVPENEERAYFLKAQAQRKQRQFRGDKHKNKRGQDKLISRVLKKESGQSDSSSKSHDIPVKSKGTHIVFSDSDTEQ